MLFIQFHLLAEIVSDKNVRQLSWLYQPIYIEATATAGKDNGHSH